MEFFFAFLGVVALIGVLELGRRAMLRENERRVDEWARANGFTLLRCERELNLDGRARPRWRVRVQAKDGESRDALLRAGWSIREPVEVEWMPPGQSAFR